MQKALNNFLGKIVGTSTDYALVLKYFAYFVKSQGLFSNTPLVENLDLFPHEWWDLIGIDGDITRCILVQVCFASLCKWNWSSYSFVHSKVQSRLTSN
jgi:hypothetical protein